MAAAGPLSTEEYEAAEILWLCEMQQAVVESPRFKSLKNQLGLYTDDNGLLRCKGTLQNALFHLTLSDLFFCPPITT